MPKGRPARAASAAARTAHTLATAVVDAQRKANAGRLLTRVLALADNSDPHELRRVLARLNKLGRAQHVPPSFNDWAQVRAAARWFSHLCNDSVPGWLIDALACGGRAAARAFVDERGMEHVEAAVREFRGTHSRGKFIPSPANCGWESNRAQGLRAIVIHVAAHDPGSVDVVRAEAQKARARMELMMKRREFVTYNVYVAFDI